MANSRKQGKQAAREWLLDRAANPQPVPSIEEVRRKLGWKLAAARKSKG